MAKYLDDIAKNDATSYVDSATNDVEALYYESFRIFIIFKSELEKYQTNDYNYNISLPEGKDIQLPNFGNILNELSQNSIFSEKNKKILSDLYNGNLCLLLFYYYLLMKQTKITKIAKNFYLLFY